MELKSVFLAIGLLALPSFAGMAGTASAAEAPVSTLQPGSLRVCVFAWPPFASKQQDGTWSGWDVEYMAAFAASAGLSMELVELPEFKGIWNAPGSDRCDVAATGISYLRSREAETGPAGHWSAYYFGVSRAYLVRTADAGKLSGVQDLGGKTVIVTDQSTAHHDLVNRMTAAGLKDVKITFTNDEVLAAKTVRDTTDPNGPFAYGAGIASVRDLAATLGGLSVAWEHCNMLEDGSERTEPFSFVVRSASTGLPELLDAFIASGRFAYAGGKGSDISCSGGAP